MPKVTDTWEVEVVSLTDFQRQALIELVGENGKWDDQAAFDDLKEKLYASKRIYVTVG